MKSIAFGFVYKITNRLNNKSYIGVTVRMPKERWQEHIGTSSNSHIHRSIHRYGVENFTFEEIDSATAPGELMELEKYYINSFSTLAPKGYNQSEGGDFPEAIPITLNGVEFSSPAAAARHHGLDLKLVRIRLSKPNWTVQQAYGIDDPPIFHSHSIEILGKLFSSITQAAIEFNLDHRVVWTRLQNGWTPEQAVGLEKKPGTFSIFDQEYDSFNHAARSYGLEPYLVRTRINNGWTNEQAFGLEPAPMTINFRGIIYENLTELAKAFDKPREQLRRRLRRSENWTIEQALDFADPPNSIRYKGKLFKDKGTLAKAFGIKPGTLNFRITKGGWTVGQAVGEEEPPRYIKKGTRIDFEHAGKRYFFPSIEEACRYFKINSGTAKSRKKLGWSLPESFELVEHSRPIQMGTETIVEGIYYPNIKLLSEAYKLNKRLVEDRLGRGWSPEQAVGVQPSPRNSKS